MASRVTVSDPASHFSIALNFLIFLRKQVGAQAQLLSSNLVDSAEILLVL